MKFKERIILFGSFIILILIVIFFCCFSNNKIYTNKKGTEKVVNNMNNEILDAVKNNKNMNIYFTDNMRQDSGYYSMFMAFNNVYNVDVKIYDISNEKEGSMNILNKKLNLQNDFLKVSALLFIRGNEYFGYGVVNYEYELYTYFKEMNALNENYMNYDIYIRTDNDFDKVFNSPSEEIIIDCSPNNQGYKFRSMIHELSKKYNFKYHVLFYHYGGATKGDIIIDGKLKNKVNVPLLMIVKNGKLLDYTDKDNAVLIKKFLKKNKMIK